MANPTDGPTGQFRVLLDDGQVVETDGSTISDPDSGLTVPAVLLRMSPARAHVLAQVLEDWSRVALVFATLHSSLVTEKALAWTLDAGAAAAGDTAASTRGPQETGRPSLAQRLAAVTVLKEREQHISAVQRIAVVDAAAQWLAEDAGEEMAHALLEAVCSQATTVNFAYLALIGQPGMPA